MPSYHHGIIEANLSNEFFKRRELRPCIELTIEFGGRVLTPDISLYPREAVDFRRGDLIRRTDPPLLTVKIISPRQGMDEVMEKVDVYLANGVRSVWLVTPPLREVTIFTPRRIFVERAMRFARDARSGRTATRSIASTFAQPDGRHPLLCFDRHDPGSADAR